MSFQASDLSVLAYANNFTLWHYKTTDTTITSAGYLNKASDMLRVNDLIIANLATGGTASTVFYIVTGNANGVVTLAAYGS